MQREIFSRIQHVGLLNQWVWNTTWGEKKLKNDIVKLLRSLFVFVLRQHKKWIRAACCSPGTVTFWPANSYNQPCKSKQSSTDPQPIRRGGGGCFHFTCGHYSLAGSPLAKQEMQSVLFMKSSYFPLLFVRNHFHTRHVFPIVLTRLEILVFYDWNMQKGWNRYSYRKSVVSCVCEV